MIIYWGKRDFKPGDLLSPRTWMASYTATPLLVDPGGHLAPSCLYLCPLNAFQNQARGKYKPAWFAFSTPVPPLGSFTSGFLFLTSSNHFLWKYYQPRHAYSVCFYPHRHVCLFIVHNSHFQLVPVGVNINNSSGHWNSL